MRSVRIAYHLGPPRGALSQLVKTLLYTAVLIATIALTLTYLFPFHSYASFNFLINTAFLIGEIAVMRQLKKSQLIQLALTFLYSAFIECTPRGLYFIQPEGILEKISPVPAGMYYLIHRSCIYNKIPDLPLCRWKDW